MVTAAGITEAGAAVITVAEAAVIAAAGEAIVAATMVEVMADTGVAIAADIAMADGMAMVTGGDIDPTTHTTGRTIDPTTTPPTIRRMFTERLTTRTRITIPTITIRARDLASPIGVIDLDLQV